MAKIPSITIHAYAESLIRLTFEEWDRRYRENPQQFMSEVEHLLGHTPETYGEACAAYFVALANELSQ